MTPEEKLCSSTWRLRNSAGVLWTILSFGLLTGVGFLIRGIKSKNKLWIGMGIGFLIVGIGLFITPSTYEVGTKEAPVTSTANTIWGWTLLLNFAGGMVATFVANRKWLVWKAHASDTKWYAQARTSAPPVNATPPMGYDPGAAGAAFRSASQLPAAQPLQPVPPAQTFSGQSVPATSIDVNRAPAQEIATALGIDHSAAQRIVEVRQNQGPYTSFEQFMTRAQVQPHLLIPHRHKLVFGDARSADTSAPAQPEPTRRSSNQAARRLDL